MAPGEVAAQLPEKPPQEGDGLAGVLQEVERILLPGLTHWQHPRFFAYFPANSSRASVLAELLSAGLAVQGMIWETAPAATEMETRVLDWLRQMLGLGEGWHGAIQDTASTATLAALVAARERATGFAANEDGMRGGPPLTLYCSEEAHSSVEKGAKIAGFGRRAVRKIGTDAALSMRPDLLEAAIAEDLANGCKPVAAVATLGTTAGAGFDPLREIGALCRRHGIWLHVDAAWAGSAMILPEQRWMSEGIEAADSFVFNPHKWLFTNFDCSAFYVRDSDTLVRSFAILPEYLKHARQGAVVDYRDWGIQLGRRFRALKLWFVIRDYGVSGLQEALRAHIAWAQELAGQVRAAPDFELLVDPRLALLCLRYRPAGTHGRDDLDALNARLLAALNDSGRIYLSQARIRGAYALRLAVGQTATERRHVQEAWALIQETARELRPLSG